MHIVSPLRCNGIVEVRWKTTWRIFPFVTNFGVKKNTFCTLKNTIFQQFERDLGAYDSCAYIYRLTYVQMFCWSAFKNCCRELSWVVVRGRELSVFSATEFISIRYPFVICVKMSEKVVAWYGKISRPIDSDPSFTKVKNSKMQRFVWILIFNFYLISFLVTTFIKINSKSTLHFA